MEGDRVMLTSEEWWAKAEWTDEHYQLARRLMRGIRVLPPDWDDDVIQEVARRYPKARSTGEGGNYRAWLRSILYRQAIDIHRKELHERTKEENRPIFVGLEYLEERGL
jgi:DNA-directed RNA polymerase specialized sigma24 family protein